MSEQPTQNTNLVGWYEIPPESQQRVQWVQWAQWAQSGWRAKFIKAAREFFSNKTNRWMAGIFTVAAYLMLFNLGNAPLWHDEGSIGLMGKMFLNTGSLNAWDGRTLHVGNNGVAANSDLIVASYPPWPMLPSALGIAIFGPNEVGVRFFHAFLGVLSLLIFWQLLCLDFAARARLRLIVFALFALSTQVILFMRMGRYVADSFFFVLLSFYAYRLYTAPGGRVWHLALAALAVLLGFLNHFAIGASFALALGVWHLLFHFRSTTLRQWLEISAAAAIVAALCLLYLWSLKIILSDENLEFSSAAYTLPLVERKLTLVQQNFRDMLRYAMLPLWVAVWFGWFVLYTFYRRINAVPIEQIAQTAVAPGRKQPSGPKETGKLKVLLISPMNRHIATAFRWVVLGVLFVTISGVLSVRSPTEHAVADSRYIAPVLLFIALVCGLLVDWLWRLWRRRRVGKYIALLTMALLLTSNVLAYPYILRNDHTGRTLNLLLPNLIGEIHRPYNNYTRQAVEYLRAHAKQDETIFVYPWQEFTVMQVYFSHQLKFCCSLFGNSPLPREKVDAIDPSLYDGVIDPDWRLVHGSWVDDYPEYELVYTAESYAYPMQRPELEFHSYTPEKESNVLLRIYRKREGH